MSKHIYTHGGEHTVIQKHVDVVPCGIQMLVARANATSVKTTNCLTTSSCTHTVAHTNKLRNFTTFLLNAIKYVLCDKMLHDMPSRRRGLDIS